MGTFSSCLVNCEERVIKVKSHQLYLVLGAGNNKKTIAVLFQFFKHGCNHQLLLIDHYFNCLILYTYENTF